VIAPPQTIEPLMAIIKAHDAAVVGARSSEASSE
jgi:hypothetical protein